MAYVGWARAQSARVGGESHMIDGAPLDRSHVTWRATRNAHPFCRDLQPPLGQRLCVDYARHHIEPANRVLEDSTYGLASPDEENFMSFLRIVSDTNARASACRQNCRARSSRSLLFRRSRNSRAR